MPRRSARQRAGDVAAATAGDDDGGDGPLVPLPPKPPPNSIHGPARSPKTFASLVEKALQPEAVATQPRGAATSHWYSPRQ